MQRLERLALTQEAGGMLNRQIKRQLDIGGEDKLDQQTLGDKDVLNQYGRMRDVQANMVGLLTF